jgi:hypothetical protein
MEQRVKTLEYEIKILKNEIQRTLLNIQEQILIHYYPALRSDNETPSEGVVQSLESIRERRASTGEEQASASAVKKVSLEDLEDGSGAAKGTAQEEAMRLSAWVSQSVGRIGKERTARLIESCVSSGWIDPDSKTVLQKFASLSDDEGVPMAVAVNEILAVIMALNPLIEQEVDVETALSLIEEANLG